MTTLRDMKLKGYGATSDMTLQRGYVSRKFGNVDEKRVYKAGGKRKGQYYILQPNFSSTNYCWRQYLAKFYDPETEMDKIKKYLLGEE